MPHQNRDKRVTLADVAREAGVSVQTASHALSGTNTSRIADATRLRVQEAAKRIRYRPNLLAQAMRSGKTNVVSVWMPLDRAIPTYQRYLHAFQLHAEQSGFQLMVTGLSTRSALKEGGDLPKIWPVDGIISVDAGKAVELLRMDTQYDAIPVVLLGYEDVANSDRVTWNITGAVSRAVSELIGMGCRRIVHMTPRWVLDGFPQERRRRGYTEAMQSAGLPLEFLAVSEDSIALAEREASVYFEKHGVPEAIHCFTDIVAVGAGRAVLSAGKRIPEDCMIIGQGDFPESAVVSVPISTIRSPLEEITKCAWSWLLERIADPSIPPRFVEYEMDIVHRESTLR